MSRSRRRVVASACLATVLLLGSWLARPAVVRAGGELDDLVDAAQLKAWRRSGLAAAPAVMKALCADDGALEYTAKAMVLEWGPGAVKPLLDVVARELGVREGVVRCLGVADEIFRALLCHAGRPSEGDVQLEAFAEDDPRVVARVKPRLRTILQPIHAALASRKAANAEAALSALDSAAIAEDCPNKQLVLALSAAPAIALLGPARFDPAPAETKADRLHVIADFGPAVAQAVPRAIALLDDPALQGDVIALLGAIGPASAPAVPRLRALLKGTSTAAAAIALGNIGAAARDAVPDLVALLEASNRAGCDKSQATLYLSGAIGKLGATGAAEAASAIKILTATLGACPRFEEELIKALGAVGTRGAAAAPALRAIMKDQARPIDRRVLASRTLILLGAPLGGDDSALIVALEKKQSLRSFLWMDDGAQAQMPQPRKPKTPAEIEQSHLAFAAAHATHQVKMCREEAGRSAGWDELAKAPPKLGDLGSLERLSACLYERLCGPTATSYAAAMTTCCRAAFGSKPAAWCTAS